MRKAQAAMEFLMTYGWAILVVLVAIGALAYFGVLQSDRLVPEFCQIGTNGLNCLDHVVDSSSVSLVISNSFGKTVDILNVTVDGCTGSDSQSIPNDGQYAFVINGCSNMLGDRFDGEFHITYVTESGLDHSSTGSISSRVD